MRFIGMDYKFVVSYPVKTLFAGQMRVNIASFEKWYANQIKYHKVNGEELGKMILFYIRSCQDIGD